MHSEAGKDNLMRNPSLAQTHTCVCAHVQPNPQTCPYTSRSPLILLYKPTLHSGHGYLVLSKFDYNPLIYVILFIIFLTLCLLAFAKVQSVFTLQTLVLPQCKA